MERALSTLALRRLWHEVFDPCPELSKLYGDRNREFLDPFLEDAARRRLSMGWTLHAQLLLWMEETGRFAPTPGLTQELLAAAAARWAMSDQSDAKGMLLRCPGMADQGLVAWKLRSFEEDCRVVLVRLAAPDVPSAGVFYAAFPDFRYPDSPEWRPLPA